TRLPDWTHHTGTSGSSAHRSVTLAASNSWRCIQDDIRIRAVCLATVNGGDHLRASRPIHYRSHVGNVRARSLFDMPAISAVHTRGPISRLFRTLPCNQQTNPRN